MAAQPEPRAPAVRMVPGILYSPLRNRARIMGSGLEVFEIIGPYRLVNEDFARLQEWFHWLSVEQLRAAIAFAEANPDFVEAELAEMRAAEQRILARQHARESERQ